MTNANKIRCQVLAILWTFILSVPVCALDPNQPANTYLRTHFTTDEGLPGGTVNQTEQTPDGFLWLTTNGVNLVRFDGKSFYQFETQARSVAVAPNGDLWVGTFGEVLRVPSSSFNQFTVAGWISYHNGLNKGNQINCLRFSRSGQLWVGTAEGLFRLDGDQFVAIGPRLPTVHITEAPDGHMLVITAQGFTELAGSEVVAHPGLADQLGVKDTEIFDVLKDTHGNTWYCTANGVARETSGQIVKLGTYAAGGHGAFLAYEDAQGTVWIGKDEGLFRATSDGVDLVTGQIQIRSLYSDRDGDLWVGTNGDGLYRFKDRAVRMFSAENGLPDKPIMTVMAAHDGTVWTGANCGGISRFDGTRFQTYNEKDGLLNSCVWALAEDANRDLWIGTWGGGAFRYHDGKFTQYSKAQGIDDRVTSIVAARDGAVWFATRGGLTCLRNGQFRNYTKADGLSANSIARVFEDRAGVIWSASRQGLDRLVGDRFENFTSVPKALVFPLGEDQRGDFFFAVDAPSATLRLYKARTDTIKDLPTPIDMVETDRGEIWFAGDGINRLAADNFVQQRPQDEPLDYESFSIADGLATAQTSGVARVMALSPDGRLWIATPKGLAMFDLPRLPTPHTKPAVYLTEVTIGRNTQHAGHDIVLPPGTSHVQIDFGAIEISAPEKTRLQYRLDGVDSEWLDAGPDPHAIYSTMPVGTHVFHVRACNRNGIWDRQGAVFTITQKPYFYQTRWFVAAIVALGLLLVGLAYSLRVRQISRRMTARFDERLAERTRVAREIHDTFLQTVQGSKMVADHALKDPTDQRRMVRALEQLSTWLAQASEEGRAALHSLRESTTEKNDLAESFRRAIDECRSQSSAQISFSLSGGPREVHPVVRDEIYRIGYEAIRNACAHSGAGRIEITLEYAHSLTFRITDNGTGIDSEVAQKGKEGHFGLRGMKERAERIGSKFTLASSPDAGTVITLVVPARIAFPGATHRWSEHLKSLFTNH